MKDRKSKDDRGNQTDNNSGMTEEVINTLYKHLDPDTYFKLRKKEYLYSNGKTKALYQYEYSGRVTSRNEHQSYDETGKLVSKNLYKKSTQECGEDSHQQEVFGDKPSKSGRREVEECVNGKAVKRTTYQSEDGAPEQVSHVETIEYDDKGRKLKSVYTSNYSGSKAVTQKDYS